MPRTRRRTSVEALAALLGEKQAVRLCQYHGGLTIPNYTYQLVAARIAWAAVTRERDRPMALAAHGVFGLVLPIALAAVMLFPALEMAHESIRGRPLTPRCRRR